MLLARWEPELMQKHSIPRQQQWNKTKHDLSPPRTKWSPVLAPQTLVQRCAILWVVHLFRPRLLPNFSVHLCVTPGASPAPHAKLCAIRLLCFFEAVATPAVMHVAACLCYSLRDFFRGRGSSSLRQLLSTGFFCDRPRCDPTMALHLVLMLLSCLVVFFLEANGL